MTALVSIPGTISADEFRNVIGHFATGVTVVTVADEDGHAGATASAMTSLSLEPPMLLVCMNSASTTAQRVSRAGHFAVNILNEHQGALARHFAAKIADKFRDVETVLGRFGQPLIPDALASLECRVVEQVRGGTHLVFMAEVESGTASGGLPLAYYRGRFGRLVLPSVAEAA